MIISNQYCKKWIGNLSVFGFSSSVLKTYSHTEKWNCKCGKTLMVYYDLYGTSSGGGSCECGAKVIVN